MRTVYNLVPCRAARSLALVPDHVRLEPSIQANNNIIAIMKTEFTQSKFPAASRLWTAFLKVSEATALGLPALQKAPVLRSSIQMYCRQSQHWIKHPVFVTLRLGKVGARGIYRMAVFQCR
mmetsp:Transcript_9411/g.12247  ORF Transcript_9411/g.12247 Transcript_9411/m.12247 type:complete len:121 (-) Transcript_9411:345-707(-)